MRYRHILHIDDDEDDQEIFLSALRKISSSVQYTGVSNPLEALQQIADASIRPDIIFLDMNMPEMNGEQFLRKLYSRIRPEQLPVIVLSTSAHKPTLAVMKELGARDFITKPDNLGELSARLVAVLD